MSQRGRGGTRGRGRGKKTTWSWEKYRPGPEVDEMLYHVRHAPAPVVYRLPNQCPVSGAHSSRVMSRHKTEDGFGRVYYTVEITYRAEGESEQTVRREVDLSQILDFVSPREHERFEENEFRLEAAAEAAADMAEAQELRQQRLARNARVPGMGRGSRLLSGLGLHQQEDSLHTRGSSRGRGRGRPRGRGRGRGAVPAGVAARTMGMQVAEEETEQEEPVAASPSSVRRGMGLGPQQIPVPTSPASSDWPDSQDGMPDEDEDEDEDTRPALQPSPDLMRSSFVANSALPDMALPSLHLYPEDSERNEEGRSISSAAAQLHIEEAFQDHAPFGSDDDDDSLPDNDRHHSKRRRTENGASSRRSRSQISHPQPRVVVPAKPMSNSQDPVASSSSPNSASESENKDIDEIDGEVEEYVVEAVLDHAFEAGTKYYLVKWEGTDNAQDWLPERELEGAKGLIHDYEANLNRKKWK